MNKDELKTYLKRTRRLLRFWDMEVPKRKVYLDEVSNNTKGKYKCMPHTVNELKDCGSVGCVAGWAFALAMRDGLATYEDSRLNKMEEHYGLDDIWCSLFDMRLNPKISQWREARMRIEDRIKQLQVLTKDASR